MGLKTTLNHYPIDMSSSFVWDKFVCHKSMTLDYYNQNVSLFFQKIMIANTLTVDPFLPEIKLDYYNIDQIQIGCFKMIDRLRLNCYNELR